MTRIAFYAPIKPPDHPIASGDRLIARNTITALERAGFEVFIASSFISYSKNPDSNILASKKSGALEEAERVIATLRSNPPDLWFTYHPYCKAVDWIGSRVTEELDIPYVTLEACRTGQGSVWDDWSAESRACLRRADLHFCLKPQDKSYLKDVVGVKASCVDVPPYIDTDIPTNLPAFERPAGWRDDVPVIVSVGMMRPGKKTDNYVILSKALDSLTHLDWNLILVGSGPNQLKIGEIFGSCSFDESRFILPAHIEQPGVLGIFLDSDIFVWPGFLEPIGMVYLEAQLMGLPVIGMNSLGHPPIVHGKTGLVVDECGPNDDLSSLSDSIGMLLSHPELRRDLGSSASSYVRDNHSLDSVSSLFGGSIMDLLSRGDT